MAGSLLLPVHTWDFQISRQKGDLATSSTACELQYLRLGAPNGISPAPSTSFRKMRPTLDSKVRTSTTYKPVQATCTKRPIHVPGCTWSTLKHAHVVVVGAVGEDHGVRLVLNQSDESTHANTQRLSESLPATIRRMGHRKVV